MLNYANLNDIEFEYLCQDVVSRMLNVKLQRFGSGKDGGIDLTDDSYRKNIVVQVKHYVKTGNAGLISSLSKEIDKVEDINPKQYYVCCSKELNPQEKATICAMFTGYMASTQNIITLIEIDDFLNKEENADILRKHFKLWVESTNVLTNLLNNDIFIDAETLLYNIEAEEKMFVKTKAFNKAIESLTKNNVLIIVGDPGVGKTITSKMIVLYYAAQGYKVRSTTDVSDLSALKRALAASKDVKEIILLDDCFGQAYFSMKDTQENELISLIRYVRMNSNKILIMNSRVTIYKEAQERTSELIKSFDRKEYKVFLLNMSNLSTIEKAKILYNQLYFNNVSSQYFDVIKENKNYLKIINHPNYNPRIIEYMCNEKRISNISRDEYLIFITNSLDNPKEAWKNEYERRLSQIDRVFVATIYSLTQNLISLDFAKKCFNYRLQFIPGVDLSVNQFEASLARLNGSFIKVVDKFGKEVISLANPSINDFIRAYLDNNITEKEEMIKHAVSVRQLNRLMDNKSFEQFLRKCFNDKSIFQYNFETKFQEAAFITEYVAKNNVLDENYAYMVKEYTKTLGDVEIYDNHKIIGSSLISILFGEEFCLFYELDKIAKDFDFMIKLLDSFTLEDVTTYIESVDWLMVGNSRKPFIESMTNLLKSSIEWYMCDVPVDSYDINVGELVDESRYEDEDGGHIDGDWVVENVESIVKDIVQDAVTDILKGLPSDIIIDKEFLNQINVSVTGADTLVRNYLQDDYYDDDYRYEQEFIYDELDYIFNR